MLLDDDDDESSWQFLNEGSLVVAVRLTMAAAAVDRATDSDK
jgi:hypothetical protein